MTAYPQPGPAPRPRGRRRVAGFVIGALVLALVLAVVALAAVGPLREMIVGSEHQAVVVEPEGGGQRSPDELRLQPYTGEQVTVSVPETWAERPPDEEAQEDPAVGYEVRFDDTFHAHAFQMRLFHTESADQTMDALTLLQTVADGRAEEQTDHEEVRLEAISTETWPQATSAAELETLHTLDGLERLLLGATAPERFRLQRVVSDGSAVHSLTVTGPADQREAYSGVIDEIFASWQVS